MNTEDDTQKGTQPPTPRSVKRGAFPTPQSEIDKAKVFVPPGTKDEDQARPAAEQSPDDNDKFDDN